MSDQRDRDAEVTRAVLTIAAFMIVPVVVLIGVVAFVQAAGASLPFILLGACALGAAFAAFKYRRSTVGVHRAHEHELLEAIARAEAQQQALPRQIAEAALDREFLRHAIVLRGRLRQAIGEIANALYAEEFLSPLSLSPHIPVEAERVYDIEYDRRTLKKGEEPPHRLRTDEHGRPTTLDLLSFEDRLRIYAASTVNPDATIGLFVSTFADLAAAILGTAPAVAGGSFTVPLIDLAVDSRQSIAAVLEVVSRRSVRQWHHFGSVRDAYVRNRERVSEATLRQRDFDAGQRLDPHEFTGTPREAVEAFLAGTIVKQLFLIEVPFALPAERRFEGQLLVARQGAGKTNALECLIYNDLAEVAAGRASLVVMDSQGLASDGLIGRLASLDYFGPGRPLEGKLIYLEPDLDWPLALNLFDIGIADIRRMSARDREAIVSSACDVVEFLFAGLLAGDLSDNMTMLYRYLVPAMLAIPNADMNTFIELLDTGSGKDGAAGAFDKYRPYFAALDPDIRSFLESDYLRDPELLKTKAAVRRRLRATLADTHFRRMFTQPRNKLDLFRQLQSGTVILVNTFPAGNYVEQFGRLILALIMQATHKRLALDREERLPTFIYLDECQDYVSREGRIARYIDKCRKQNVGLVFATQRLGTIESPAVLDALSGVPIKFAGSSDADAQELAGMVGSTAEHIRALPRGRFAVHVSGFTPHAVDVSFPASPLTHAPRVNAEGFTRMRAEMRSRFSTPHFAPEAESEVYEAAYDVAVERAALPGPEPDVEPPDDDYDPLR